MSGVTAVIVAAGASTRFGEQKLLVLLRGKTVIERAIDAFLQNPDIDDVVVVSGGKVADFVKKLAAQKPVTVVEGGERRCDSVKNGVTAAKGAFVAIHDGARPLVSQEIISETVAAAKKYGAAAPFLPLKDSVKRSEGEYAGEDVPREGLFAAQTPQIFDRSQYLSALEKADGTETDDCAVAAKSGIKVFRTSGEPRNLKITSREDLPLAQYYMGPALRVGHGYDVHRFAEGRELWLCGVNIPCESGLLGHSDADVALHAVMDALLGAAGLPDIGCCFPDSDPAYEGADSLGLLHSVCARVRAAGFEIVNVDSTVVAQAPRLSPYIGRMRANLARAAGLDISRMSVKATTEEGLGFTGTGEGIAAQAVALLD